MSNLSTEERFQRLERTVMMFFALATGELQKVTSSEELAEVQRLVAVDCEAMRDDLDE